MKSYIFIFGLISFCGLMASQANAQVLDGPLEQQQALPVARPAEAADPTSPNVLILPDEGATRGVIVTDRVHPEYQPQGMQVGTFRFMPDLTVDELYNDNIYATKNNPVDDWVTTFEPRLALRSDWSRHALNFMAASGDGVYADKTSENYNDFLLQADGRLDITRRTRLAGLLSYAGDHEERGSPDDITQQTHPVTFNVATAQGELFHEFNKLKLDVIYSNQDFQYNNGHTEQGAIVNDDVRDRDDNEVTGRIALQFTPGYDAYVQSSYNNRDYDDSHGVSNFGRVNSNSDGYNIYGGLHADVTGKLFGDIYAGYITQSYDDPIYKDYHGVGFGVNGYWNITGLTTLTANVGRDIEETIVPGASGYVETRARLNLDQELRRNVVLSGLVGYDNDDYQGADRTDHVWVAGGGLKYLVNQHVTLFGNYAYINRNSNQDFNDYTQNRYLVGIKAAL